MIGLIPTERHILYRQPLYTFKKKTFQYIPPVTVSSVNALNRQLPTWFRMHWTWPWSTSSKMAVSCSNARVVNFFRRRLCMVKNRPVHACRRRGYSNLSSYISPSNNGRSLSESDIRRWFSFAARKRNQHYFRCGFMGDNYIYLNYQVINDGDDDANLRERVKKLPNYIIALLHTDNLCIHPPL